MMQVGVIIFCLKFDSSLRPILKDFRKGKYDVLVGINLLREGIDLPEVSLVAILDADKEGFLRSDTSLIQIIGRASSRSSQSSWPRCVLGLGLGEVRLG